MTSRTLTLKSGRIAFKGMRLARSRASDNGETTVHGTIRRAQRGDRRAFELLWDQYAPTLHAILLSMVSRQEAEDLLQDVALRAWKAIHGLDDPDCFSPWLCTIARNLGRNALASKNGHTTISLRDREGARLAAGDAGPGGMSEAKEIMRYIRELPKAYRETVALRLVMDLTGPEIAERTGLTTGSVRVNLCRGMKILRERLEADGIVP